MLPTPVFLGFPCVAQLVKNLPAMQETWVQSLSREDPLEEGMATQSSILAWRIPMDRRAWWAIVQGVTKSRMWLSDFHFHFSLVVQWLKRCIPNTWDTGSILGQGTRSHMLS